MLMPPGPQRHGWASLYESQVQGDQQGLPGFPSLAALGISSLQSFSSLKYFGAGPCSCPWMPLNFSLLTCKIRIISFLYYSTHLLYIMIKWGSRKVLLALQKKEANLMLLYKKIFHYDISLLLYVK